MFDTFPKAEPLGLRHYFLLAWKWAWLIVLLAALAAGVAFVASRMSPSVYQARTKLLINEATGKDLNDYTALLMSERQARTYAEMITNRLLLEAVIVDLDLQMNAQSLAQVVKVELIKDTRLIALTVENVDPQQAAEIANTIAARFIEQLQSLENSAYQSTRLNLEEQMLLVDEEIQATSAIIEALSADSDPLERERLITRLDEYRKTYTSLLLKYEDARLAEASTSNNIVHLEPAMTPTEPVRPRVKVNTILAGVLGMALAISAIFLVESLDDTLHTPDDVSRYLGLPVFGVIPQHETVPGSPVTSVGPRTPPSDAYRALRANIHFASVDRPLKKLLITSAMPGEGKSTIAVNLSISISQNERRTILLDCDFRRPNIHKTIGVANRRGLSHLLASQELSLDDSLQSTAMPNLRVLSIGELPPNPTELLSSEKMQHILQLLSEQSDMLVVDTPPITAVTDAAVLASRMDGILLIIKPGVTRIHTARQTIEQLRRAKANLLGVVLNAVDTRRDGYYSNYYYQHYHYSEKKPARRFLDRFHKTGASTPVED